MPRNRKAIGPLDARMARIAGQVRGVGRMIDEERPYREIYNLLSAAVGALKQVQLKLLAEHLQSCVPIAGKTWRPGKLQERVNEMFLAVADERYGRASQSEVAGRLQNARPTENDDANRTRRCKP